MLRHRTFLTLYLVFLIVFFIVVPDMAKSHDNPKTIQDTIQSASELDYPPFSIVRNDGNADGFSVELLRAAVKAIGKDILFVVGPWNEIKQKLIDGHFDVLPLVSYSDERDKILDFSTPYLRMHGTIFVRKGEESIQTEADLLNKEVLVMKGDTAHEYAVRKKLSNKLILKSSFEEAMRDLSNGKHDALIVQQLVGFQLIKKLEIKNIIDISSFEETSLKHVAKPLSGFEQKFCFAVPEGNKELLSLLNEGLSLVIANGTFDKLYQKWFGPILPQPSVAFAVIVKYLLFFLVPILFLISIFGIWYLKREVARKTNYLKNEIKERELTQNALQDSEKKYRLLIDDVPDIRYQTDMEGNIVFVSKAIQNLSGYSQKEAVGMNISDMYLYPEKREKFLSTLLEKRYVNDYETQLKGKDGTIWWASANAKLNRDPNGNILGVEGTIRDVTQRKLAEKELRMAEKRFRAVFEQAPIGIGIVDSKTGQFLHINSKYCEIVGYSEEEMISLNFLKITHPDDLKEDLDNMARLRAGEINDFRMEKRYISKGGTTVFVRLAVVALWGEELQRKSHLAIVEDITKQKKAENEKIKLESQLQQAQKMEAIGTLAGGIAHDFNNILSSILGFAALVKQDLFEHDSELKSNIDQVIIAGHRATDLVQHILTFSRHSEIDKKPLLVSLLIKETIKFLRATLPASIEIKSNILYKDATILGDATHIHQVVMNLCTNATQAMKKDGGVLTLSLGKKTLSAVDIIKHEAIKPGDYIKLSISDTGHGIPDELINRIFEPFFTTKRKGEGSGMGLSVVHGIIKEMGGTISVESEPGKGSAFHIMIPMHKTIPVHDNNAHDQVIQKGEGHVLYVDDEKSILRFADKMLQRAGYKVTTVNNSIDALVLFKSDPKAFDIIITDFDMPKMDGLEFSKQILKDNPDMPIILSTGFSRKITQELLDKIGIHKMIMKPIITSELVETINSALKLNH